MLNFLGFDTINNLLFKHQPNTNTKNKQAALSVQINYFSETPLQGKNTLTSHASNRSLYSLRSRSNWDYE